MDKEDPAPGPGGLLSKVVRFVRNPTVDWADLDSLGESRESQFSRQALKEMIERKRRNDFVRRREFDQLRKLRRKGPVQPASPTDASRITSFFDTNTGEHRERAETLRKIDVIEQQMSRQWWKAPGAARAAAPAGDAEEAPSALSTAPAGAGATTLPPTPDAAAASPDDSSVRAFAPTMPLGLPPTPGGVAPRRPLFADDNASNPFAPDAGAKDTGSGEEIFVHEPDLEEAAILFANADHAGAARCLMGVITQHAQDDPQQQHEIWMTLFDLYRATGAQEPFDALAIDYAARFGRSAPLWFSLPEQLGMARPAPAAPARRELSWSAPAALGQQTVAALQASLKQAAQPWTLNWARLTEIDEGAAAALRALFTQWADQRVKLQFHGVSALQQVLQAHTVAGERGVDPQWWLLRMALLRLMGQADAFEMTALDYCVTYEVSPPSWADARCSYSDEDTPSAQEVTVTGAGLLVAQDAPVPSAAELSGQIEGDAEAQLQALAALVPGEQPVVIDCERLIRIDFAAVGSVLNWAAAQQAQGRKLHFRNLHRLVAVFFNVIGINEHARVEPRKD